MLMGSSPHASQHRTERPRSTQTLLRATRHPNSGATLLGTRAVGAQHTRHHCSRHSGWCCGAVRCWPCSASAREIHRPRAHSTALLHLLQLCSSQRPSPSFLLAERLAARREVTTRHTLCAAPELFARARPLHAQGAHTALLVLLQQISPRHALLLQRLPAESAGEPTPLLSLSDTACDLECD
jgi:hypothetical protein